MNNLTVVKVDKNGIHFNDGSSIDSYHDQDCCENHYLSFKDLTIDDFEGLQFDLSGDYFFERINDYGIALKPINGHPIRIPGYGENNGYYSSQIDLELICADGSVRKYDISDCQVISD